MSKKSMPAIDMWKVFEAHRPKPWRELQPKLCYHGVTVSVGDYSGATEEDGDGRPTTRLRTEKWYHAGRKIVRDSPSSREYISGFHVFIERHHAVSWLASTTARGKYGRFICLVRAINITTKPNARSFVYLAESMRISYDAWVKAICRYDGIRLDV